MGYTGQKKREYDLLWIKTRRNEWIESQGGKCVRCGSSEQLEVDHIDPSIKSYHVTQLWTRREEVREAELAKCQVLCKACHKLKTNLEDREYLNRFQHPGSQCKNTILTENDVLCIKILWVSGEFKQKELGNLFSVARQTIDHIVHNRHWKHVVL